MNPLFKFYKLLNILSIDVALGAVCCAAWFAKVFEVQLRPYALVALGITVWAIYTADHLMDASKLKTEASTHRHRFHQKYFKTLIVCLGIAVVIDFTMLFFIRAKIIHGGFALAALVGLYLLINRWLGFLKEFVVAIVYCGGVLLPSLSITNNSLAVPEVLLITSFFLTALINLIVFSRYDVQTDKRDGYNSFVIKFGDTTAQWVLVLFFFTQVVVLALLFMAHIGSYGGVLLLMNAVLFLLFLKPSYFREHDIYRLLGDAIFIFPALFLLVG